MEEELQKQESLLNALHAEINAGSTDQEKEELLWEVQRIVTQLKRKVGPTYRHPTQMEGRSNVSSSNSKEGRSNIS